MQGEMLGSERGCMRTGPLFSCECTGTEGISGAGALLRSWRYSKLSPHPE